MTRLKTYAQLLRLPNVFTALADIFLGWLAVSAQGPMVLWGTLALLLLASACLYCAGMVLNDYFDVEQDTRERPHRPIPSGRVSSKTAGILGALLLLVGISAAALVNEAAFQIATLLTGGILAYDGYMKRTWLGPLFMGGCRFLNVLLPCSASSAFPGGWMFHLAAIVGIYIVGVTLFARTEAVTSKRAVLWIAVGIMALTIPLALVLPLVWWGPSGRWEGVIYPFALLGWALALAVPLRRALTRPEPAWVQAAVKRCIFGLIVLDAVLALGVYGGGGLLIVLLILPAIVLGRYVYST